LIQDLIRDFEAPGCSKTEIAEHYGISRSSVYRLYAEHWTGSQRSLFSVLKQRPPREFEVAL
jgi:transposase